MRSTASSLRSCAAPWADSAAACACGKGGGGSWAWSAGDQKKRRRQDRWTPIRQHSTAGHHHQLVRQAASCCTHCTVCPGQGTTPGLPHLAGAGKQRLAGGALHAFHSVGCRGEGWEGSRGSARRLMREWKPQIIDRRVAGGQVHPYGAETGSCPFGPAIPCFLRPAQSSPGIHREQNMINTARKHWPVHSYQPTHTCCGVQARRAAQRGGGRCGRRLVRSRRLLAEQRLAHVLGHGALARLQHLIGVVQGWAHSRVSRGAGNLMSMRGAAVTRAGKG